MDVLLKDLASFYQELDAFLQPAHKDCGLCGECCQRTTTLRVFSPEMENIRRYVQDERLLKLFEKFTSNNVISIWGDTSGLCPFQEGLLCSVYPIRPYHCRIYGPYYHQEWGLLKGCIYQGTAKAYSKRKELPLIERLDRLIEDYHKLTVVPQSI
jgi:Fe-S-cluster containining protein